MLQKWKGSLVFFGSLAALLVIAAALFVRLAHPEQFAVPIWASVFLSVIIPFTIIAIRHQVRRNRVKLIDLFAENFALGNKSGTGQPDNVSFEFVRGKYYADLDMPPNAKPNITDIPRFPMMLHADWMLFFCAIPYIVFSSFGIFILFSPLSEILDPNGAIAGWLLPSVLVAGGTDSAMISAPGALQAFHVNVLTVAALAFAGSYFYTVRLFLRAVAAFDLSPITFLRAFTQMVLAVILAIVLYRVLPSEEAFLSSLSQLTGKSNGMAADTAGAVAVTAFDPTDGLNPFWLLLAFTLGFLPEAALQYLLQKAHLTFKHRYTELERHARQIPLTILDGIDHFIEFRLEEANVFDMQNLATANPIMLHIESPYGIYEVVDWIAQAQLCTVVGPDRFLMLKSFNIRTIFDLERAMIGSNTDAALQGVVGRMFLGDNSRDRSMRVALGLSDAPVMQLPSSEGAPAVEVPIAALENLARVMLDDLHVHRLRQVWNGIYERLLPKPAESVIQESLLNGTAVSSSVTLTDAGGPAQNTN